MKSLRLHLGIALRAPNRDGTAPGSRVRLDSHACPASPAATLKDPTDMSLFGLEIAFEAKWLPEHGDIVFP